jgi:hypothetical protein
MTAASTHKMAQPRYYITTAISYPNGHGQKIRQIAN